MNIHFIGIGGIGISALAQFCHQRGDTITGSGIEETDIMKKLRALGVDIKIPHNQNNIPGNCDLVVYTEALFSDTEKKTTDNPELQEAIKRNIPQKSYFEFLGEISGQFKTIAVAGTHGKTTTTGMIASGFNGCGLDATFFVGSKIKLFDGGNFHHGESEYLCIEACEYRNNFQFLQPEIVVLTNADLDHVDFYKDQAHYEETFTTFCRKAKVVISHKNDEAAERILQNFTGEKITVSNDQNHPHFIDTPNIDLAIAGVHNRENAALAIALANYLGQGEDHFRNGLSTFTGAWRRQEFLGEKEGVQIFDDYGHHPTEIKATLQSFRELFPGKKIGLIFEPHQFSRTRAFFKEFGESLDEADVTGIFPIYEARDTDEDKKAISVDNFFEAHPNFHRVEHLEDINALAEKLNPEDVLIFMGAGKIDQFAHKFMQSC